MANYRIHPNDTIVLIARRFQTTPEMIVRLNPNKRFVYSAVSRYDFAPGTLRVGDLIVVPDTGAAAPARRRQALRDEDCGPGQHLATLNGRFVVCVSDLMGKSCGNGGTYNEHGECVGGHGWAKKGLVTHPVAKPNVRSVADIIARRRRGGLRDEDCGDGQHLVDYGDYVACVSDNTGQPCGNGGTYNDYGECVGGSDGGAMEALQKILGAAGGQAAYNAYQSGVDGSSYAASLGLGGWNAGKTLCAIVAVVGTVLLGPFGAFLAAMCAAGASMYGGGGDNNGGGGAEGQPCKTSSGADGVVYNGNCVVPCDQNEYYDPNDKQCGCERPGFQRQDPNDVNSPCLNLNEYPRPCGKPDSGFYVMEPGGECVFAGAGDTCQQVEPDGGFTYGTYAKNGACIPDAAKTAANKPEWLCEQYGGPPGSIVWFDKLNNVWHCLAPCGPNETLDLNDGMCACNNGFKRDAVGTCVETSAAPPGGGGPPKTVPAKVPPKGIDDKPPVKPKPTGEKKEGGNGLLYGAAAVLAGLALWLGTRKKKSGS